MFKKIPANFREDSVEWSERFRVGEILSKIPGNAEEDPGDYSKRFWRMFEKIPENVQIDSGECTRVFWGSNVFTFKLIKATSFLKWPRPRLLRPPKVTANLKSYLQK